MPNYKEKQERKGRTKELQDNTIKEMAIVRPHLPMITCIYTKLTNQKILALLNQLKNNMQLYVVYKRVTLDSRAHIGFKQRNGEKFILGNSNQKPNSYIYMGQNRA